LVLEHIAFGGPFGSKTPPSGDIVGH
jgi:hypothetical protein